MTTIHLLGSEGFIGRAIQRENSTSKLHCWSHRDSDPAHHFDLLDSSSWQALLKAKPTHVILLSWPGLPNYHEPFHVTRNLPACFDLIEKLVSSGLKRLVVAGTCYEYGLMNGQLKESEITDPMNCYAIAKDGLRRMIDSRYTELQWSWVRIFYPYGEGQNPNSLLPSLQLAIDRGDSIFPMSSGRQVRDFVPVKQVAQFFLKLASHPEAHGVCNCGSGTPISLREFVESNIAKSSSNISLKFGVYPDRTDEPLAFWADMNKSNQLI